MFSNSHLAVEQFGPFFLKDKERGSLREWNEGGISWEWQRLEDHLRIVLLIGSCWFSWGGFVYFVTLTCILFFINENLVIWSSFIILPCYYYYLILVLGMWKDAGLASWDGHIAYFRFNHDIRIDVLCPHVLVHVVAGMFIGKLKSLSWCYGRGHD